MPFRDPEHRAKIQFQADRAMPFLITQAAEATGKVSNTQYIQHVLAAALARDLGLSEQELLDALPPSKSLIPAFITDGTRHTHPAAKAAKADIQT